MLFILFIQKRNIYYKRAIGIDIGRTIKNKIAFNFNSPEVFYRHYFHRRFYILEAIGLNTYKSNLNDGQFKKIFGIYNRIGAHYVTHKWFSLKHFCRIPKEENGSIGVNFILGYVNHKGRVNFGGPLLRSPFVENINQKILFRGFELEWNPIVIKENHIQVNLNFNMV